MGLFDRFRKKEKQKVYQVNEQELSDIKLLCMIIREQLTMLSFVDQRDLELLNDGQPEYLNLKLAGYIVGLYDAQSQFRKRDFDENMLELVVEVLYGAARAKLFMRNVQAVMLIVSKKRDDPFSAAYEDFTNARIVAGTEFFSWIRKEKNVLTGLSELFASRVR